MRNSCMIIAALLGDTAAFTGASFVGLPSSKRRQFLSTQVGRQTIRTRILREKRKPQSRTLAHDEELDAEITKDIHLIAKDLWKGKPIPTLSLLGTELEAELEGEATLETNVPFLQRAEYFKKEALEKGCPKAQHSYGLMLWSGFGGVHQDAAASAKFHAAAASQNHLDGMSVFGGCLRTGSGVKQNVALGLRLIEYCATKGNPTGINKKAALLESNGDDFGAVRLYEESLERGRVNALLLFNLGWCLINGQGVEKKDQLRGLSLLEEATALAPDEGSEEAAWYLYGEYKRDDPKEAERWLDLAIELGYHDEDIDFEEEKAYISNANSFCSSDGMKIARREKCDPTNKGSVGNPMPGVMVDTYVNEGNKVEKGKTLLKITAMNMETEINAPINGVAKRVLVGATGNVSGEDLLVGAEES